MNVLLSPQPHPFLQHERLSPSRSLPPNMTSRKRKADDDGDEMSVSPQGSPSILNRAISRPSKKSRVGNELCGRPLSLPRLLETLDINQLRTVLQTICERHMDVGNEVLTLTPRPTAASVLGILEEYLDKFRAAIPYGHSSLDYTYYRVRQPLAALVDAISDFTPQFLPPNEHQMSTSLQYLDGATKIVHQILDWESPQYSHHKDNAYEEMARAWALLMSEASKRGGGFTLIRDGWNQVLAKHNQQSGGRLHQAVNVLTEVGWGQAGHNAESSGRTDQSSILDQIVSGQYGSPVRVGPW